MSTPRKRGCLGRSIVTVIIVLLVAALVCVGIIVVAAPSIGNLVNAIAAPITASNDFMTDLIAKDYTKAFALIHPSQKEAFGSDADGMEQILSEQGIVPSSFTATNVQISGDALVNGTGIFDGAKKYVYVILSKDGDSWKIIGIQVNDNAPTATPAP